MSVFTFCNPIGLAAKLVADFNPTLCAVVNNNSVLR